MYEIQYLVANCINKNLNFFNFFTVFACLFLFVITFYIVLFLKNSNNNEIFQIINFVRHGIFLFFNLQNSINTCVINLPLHFETCIKFHATSSFFSIISLNVIHKYIP